MKAVVLSLLLGSASAGQTHYGKPPCRVDEKRFDGPLKDGSVASICAPSCNASMACPADIPSGAWGKTAPACILKDPTGETFCALTCAVLGCPTGAKCDRIMIVEGICVWPNGTVTQPLLPESPPVDPVILPPVASSDDSKDHDESETATDSQALAPLSSSQTHYGKPPCRVDERRIDGQLKDGSVASICAPSCNATSSCPTDMPPGAWHKTAPSCLLTDKSSGQTYCALTCQVVGCPTGAKCDRLLIVEGICVWPNGTMAQPLMPVDPVLLPPVNAPEPKEKVEVIGDLNALAPITSAQTHYGKPPCRMDERRIDGQLRDGSVASMCAPSCNATSACPSDMPAGAWHKTAPACLLTDKSSGQTYCALTCQVVGCPTGAICDRIMIVEGICVWPNGTFVDPLHPASNMLNSDRWTAAEKEKAEDVIV